MAKEKSGMPALAISPTQAPVVSGNFGEIKSFLLNWKKKVKALKLSAESMEEVRTIKKEAVQLRNSLSEIATRTKKLYFTDPKNVFSAQMDELSSIVADVEKDADSFLGKEEEERLAGVAQVLDHYKEKFQGEYNLGESYLSRIEYKKSYFNKTADEKERKDDLEGQFKALKKEQDAYNGNVRLITTACRDEPRLHLSRYLDDLERGAFDVASILEDIEEEKKRLKELDTPPETVSSSVPVDVEAEVVEDAKVVLGASEGIDFTTDFPGKTKSIKVEITYPYDVGDALTELFNNLKAYGIKVKLLKKEAVF